MPIATRNWENYVLMCRPHKSTGNSTSYPVDGYGSHLPCIAMNNPLLTATGCKRSFNW